MILLPLLVAAAATTAPAADPARFKACLELVDTDPQAALDDAEKWRLDGGNVLARQCQGLAFAAQARWLSAMTSFQQAAEASQVAKDGRASTLWVQAANAALAGGEYVKARSFIDAALIEGTLKGPEAGEAHVDRARALVAVGDLPKARTDLDAAIKLVPQDPLMWLLSASLARRTGDLDRARTDIAEAARLSPDDPSVALEAGNISAMMGNDAAARTAWEAAVKIAPDSPQGKAAAKALEQFGAPATPEPAAPPR